MGKLVRLELYNFKSYKGHHVLLFGDSFFTSIIGPNGSGKSNSMDAISFVLGIKSSHLRSTHLRDLVYRGRVLKTSVINEDGSATVNGANGDIALSHETPSTKVLQERNDPKSAWVMAVYEDDTGDEQLWKRTITNQGASEYRINNKVVTAQQYNEALEAENILIKARNFLVFQGDVEAIASQSPKDLTRLIEQISGSLEHKAEYERMKEAQDEAIENQNFNLNRRRGINSEIKQYQEQKREADNYARKAEQRDRAIVSHVLWKLYRFQNLMAESGAEIRKHQEELKEYRRRIAKYERDLEEARKEQAKVARDVGKLERSIKEKEGEVEDKENSLLPITEKILVTKEGLTRVTSRIDTISKERESKSEAVRRLANDLKVVERAESQWEIEWRKLSERGGRALSDADLQQYSKLKEDVSKRISVDQVKATNLTRQLRADEETVRSLKGKVDTIQSRILELEMDITGTANNKTAASDVIRQTSQQAETKKKSHNYLTSERLRKSLLRKELDEKLQEVLNKLSDAEDGRKQNDKELKMKTTIADLKRFFPGVRGRVHELCTPKIRKYDQAVSTFLGRHIDAIVVDDERIANECIQYLRSERRGVATFIPLDTISGTTIDSNLKGMHKGTRMAIDTIDYDKVYDRAMSYACGNTIVCDDMSIARYICYEKGLDIKAVTLDGTVISKGGLMTGGRGKEQNSMRWEDALVDNLRKSVDRYRTDLAALAETRRETTEEETLQSELAGLDQRLVYAKEEVRAYERNLSSKEKELSHSRKELAEANSKFHEKDSELKDLKASLGTFQDAISQVEDRVFDEFCRNLGYENIRVYEAQQGSLQQEGAQKKLEFAQQKNKLESRRSLEEQQLREIDDRVDGLRAKMNRDQYLIDQLETQKKVTSDEADMLMVTLEQRKEDLIKQQALYEKKAEKATEQRREVQKRSRTVDSTLREVSRLESEIQRNATDRYALLRRCKLEDIVIPLGPDSNSLDQLPIDGILQSEPDAISLDGDRDDSGLDASSGRDYGIMIDFDDLDDELKDESDEKLDDELQNRITVLEEELKQMAPNMRAIERLEGVESRLKITEKEFEDARRHAKNAKDDFQDIKDQRFELFNKAFSHISEQIGPIYKELTKSASLPMGGQAYLDMEDSDEPYLDGIKYHAMPPLKRFRDMEHLSGGEKTMAALALLFAIHSYQPSPFFVLDEVDAALDNANVAKIANYIREHAGPGMQFIVISLKTGLFQGSEALVGIHRDQGANTSKALTLDLRKYQ